MKKIFIASALSVATLVPAVSHAATAELRLIGTITPAACVPNFTGGATIDYGNIPAASLNRTAQTTLPSKVTALNITCDSPTTFYLRGADERAATLVSELNVGNNYPLNTKFGLGATESGVNIGAYSLRIANETSDSGETRRLLSTDGGNYFGIFGGAVGSDGGRLIAFGDSATSMRPAPHTSVDMDVVVTAAIDVATNLPLQDEIYIDGLATIEVIYP